MTLIAYTNNFLNWKLYNTTINFFDKNTWSFVFSEIFVFNWHVF